MAQSVGSAIAIPSMVLALGIRGTWPHILTWIPLYWAVHSRAARIPHTPGGNVEGLESLVVIPDQ